MSHKKFSDYRMTHKADLYRPARKPKQGPKPRGSALLEELKDDVQMDGVAERPVDLEDPQGTDDRPIDLRLGPGGARGIPPRKRNPRNRPPVYYGDTPSPSPSPSPPPPPPLTPQKLRQMKEEADEVL